MQENNNTINALEETETGLPTLQQALDELRGNKKPGEVSSLNLDILSEKKTVLDKIIYVLQVNGYVTKETAEEEIIAIREKFGVRLTRRSLNTILGEINIDGNQPLKLPVGSLNMLPSELLKIWNTEWKDLFYSHWNKGESLTSALYKSAIELVELDRLNWDIFGRFITLEKKKGYISKNRFLYRISLHIENKKGIVGILVFFGIPEKEVKSMHKKDIDARINNLRFRTGGTIEKKGIKQVENTKKGKSITTIKTHSTRARAIYMIRLHQIGIHENTVTRILKYYTGINEGDLYNILQDPICKDDLDRLKDKEYRDNSYVLKNGYQARKNFEKEFYILSSKLDTFSLNVIANSRKKVLEKSEA